MGQSLGDRKTRLWCEEHREVLTSAVGSYPGEARPSAQARVSGPKQKAAGQALKTRGGQRGEKPVRGAPVSTISTRGMPAETGRAPLPREHVIHRALFSASKVVRANETHAHRHRHRHRHRRRHAETQEAYFSTVNIVLRTYCRPSDVSVLPCGYEMLAVAFWMAARVLKELSWKAGKTAGKAAGPGVRVELAGALRASILTTKTRVFIEGPFFATGQGLTAAADAVGAAVLVEVDQLELARRVEHLAHAAAA